jgi:predicted metal-dependent HD superfamily phosphohydrolase
MTDVFRTDETMVSLLREQWNDLSALYTGEEPLRAKSFEVIREKYSEEGRFYHNLSHIKALLSLFESLKHMIQDRNAIRFAIWFHDVIYNTRRSDNEEKSAELASKILSELSVDNGTIEFTRELILATRSHTGLDLSEDAKLFLDTDLSILGASEEVYREYSKAIRNEYSWVPNFMYRRSRKKILKGFGERDPLYFSEEMNKRFEKQARINIEEEIRSL